jgi:hypothetical protein
VNTGYGEQSGEGSAGERGGKAGEGSSMTGVPQARSQAAGAELGYVDDACIAGAARATEEPG